MTTDTSVVPITGADGLRATMMFIEFNLGLWDQTAYGRDTECGTTHCLAGWGVALAGGRFRPIHASDGIPHTAYDWTEIASLPPYVRDEIDPVDVLEIGGVPYVGTDAAAQILFGLEHHEAAALFCGGNSLGDLRRLVRQCALPHDGTGFQLPAHTVTVADGIPTAECARDGHDEDTCMVIGLLESHDLPEDGTYTMVASVCREDESCAWRPVDD